MVEGRLWGDNGVWCRAGCLGPLRTEAQDNDSHRSVSLSWSCQSYQHSPPAFSQVLYWDLGRCPRPLIHQKSYPTTFLQPVLSWDTFCIRRQEFWGSLTLSDASPLLFPLLPPAMRFLWWYPTCTIGVETNSSCRVRHLLLWGQTSQTQLKETVCACELHSD